MYRKYAISILLLYFLSAMIGACFCVKGTNFNLTIAKFLSQKESETEAFLQEEQTDHIEEITVYAQNTIPKIEKNREISYAVLEKNYTIRLSETDYETLLKIVEAEAGGEDYQGKLLVADVIINRVKSEMFPDTITEVVYQQEGNVSQFTPVYDGRIDTVSISEETRNAVEHALLGQDDAAGALYFVNRQYADPERMEWFDRHLTQLFSYGGHEFFL